MNYAAILTLTFLTVTVVEHFAEASEAGDKLEEFLQHLESEPQPNEEKRFYSWEGKRTRPQKLSAKRKFYAWAGKRGGSWEAQNEAPLFVEQPAEKRKFFSDEKPAEKRKFFLDENAAGKRKFYAWAGKRNQGMDGMTSEYVDYDVPAKRKFYAWAGKRNFNDEDAFEKRKFYAWAGKRAYIPLNEDYNDNYPGYYYM